jgi:hypothetical protein
MISHLKELEAEKSRLKKIDAEERLKAKTLKGLLKTSGSTVASTRTGANWLLRIIKAK